MDNSGNSRRSIIADIQLLNVVRNMNSKEVLTFAALTFALYAGGSASYVLGVAISLPSSVATLINSTTIVHLSGQLTFMAVLIFALFKVSRLIVVGILF